jgi:hypothetical protein
LGGASWPDRLRAEPTAGLRVSCAGAGGWLVLDLASLAAAERLALSAAEVADASSGPDRPAALAGSALAGSAFADSTLTGWALAGGVFGGPVWAGSALADSALAGSAFADSAFAASALADSALADSAFAGSAFGDPALAGSGSPRWRSARSGLSRPGWPDRENSPADPASVAGRLRRPGWSFSPAPASVAGVAG